MAARAVTPLAEYGGWWLSLLWGLYILAMAAWIVPQKREPVATLSWLLGLALVPILGFVLFYLFGPRRLRRERLKRLRARAAVEGRLPPPPEAGSRRTALMRLGQHAEGFPEAACREAELLLDAAALDAQLAAIRTARRHVHAEFYIFDPDATGLAFRDALIERARAGVKVRLLVDAVGSARLSRAFLAPLRAAGADVAFFHPVRLARLRRSLINHRNHRKLLLIDGETAFTGGVNVSDRQDRRRTGTDYRDLHLRLTGDVLRWLQLAFLEDWHYSTGETVPGDDLWPAPGEGGMAAQVLTSGPDMPWEPIHRLQVELIHQARERLWLATPYFVPGEALRMALESAAMRGVDVRILLPERSDSRLLDLAARSYLDSLLHAGVRVHAYGSGFLHGKALLMDRSYVLLGSANLDHRSFRLNFELSVLLHARPLNACLAETLATDMARSRRVHLPSAASRLRRFTEGLARLFSPVL